MSDVEIFARMERRDGAEILVVRRQLTESDLQCLRFRFAQGGWPPFDREVRFFFSDEFRHEAAARRGQHENWARYLPDQRPRQQPDGRWRYSLRY